MNDSLPEKNDFRKIVTRVNNAFYNESGTSFDKIPFESLLPQLLLKYALGKEILEIGSGAGALASWLVEQGYNISCVEPAQELAKQAEEKGLKVYSTTIQQFQTDQQYDNIIAISSLIHVPKVDLPQQIQKIFHLLKPNGVFFVSFIEGENEGFEDPTQIGKLRYFAKWNEKELNDLFTPYFVLVESYKVYNKKMDRTFLLRVYTKNFVNE